MTTPTTPTTTTINQIESIVQKRLHIKWVDTKRLVQNALKNCEIFVNDKSNHSIPLHRQDEIIEEACEIYTDLSEAEQDRMKIKDSTKSSNDNITNNTEPEWKRKARIQAERREAEWQTQQVVQQNQEQIHLLLSEKQTIIPPQEIPLTTIKSIRRTTNDPFASTKQVTEQPSEMSTPIIRVRRTTCYCIIQ